MSGLKASMWATERSHTYVGRPRSVPPPQPSSSSTPPPPLPRRSPATAPLAPSRALHRLEQTCLRLRWKALDLDSSWRRVDPQAAASVGFDPAVAERNFKLDFYEFYAWIEQAIVLLQRIFGVEILPGGRGGVGGVGGARMHAYHHNVLTALGDQDNPLHEALGRGDVNQALWKAKELRNRWKDEAGDGAGGDVGGGGADTPPMRMYDLQWIVGKILAGLDEGYAAARQRVLMGGGQDGAVEVDAGSGGGGSGGGGEGWDWMMEEPMDWEA